MYGISFAKPGSILTNDQAGHILMPPSFWVVAPQGVN